MSDHDFEKQVQLKMEQLRLRPSNAVWTEVEKNIRRDKRRRRVIVWLPLLLLMLGAGGYFAMKETSRPGNQHLVSQTSPSSTTPSSSTLNDQPSDSSSTQQTQENTLPATGPAANAAVTPDPAPNTPAAAPATGKTPATVPNTTEETAKKVTGNIPTHTGNNTRRIKVTTGDSGSELPPVRPKKTRVRTTNKNNNNLAVITRESSKTQPDENKQAVVPQQDSSIAITVNIDTVQTALDVATVVPTVTPVDSNSLTQTTLVDSVAKDSAQTMAAVPPAIVPEAAKAQNVQRKAGPSKWQFGIQVEGGYSGVTKDGLFGFLEKNYTPVPDLASPSFSNAITFAPQFPRPVSKPSNLTMGLSFSAGGFVKRSLSNRLSLSAGLQYTYLSTRQIVGSKVNGNRTVNRAPSTSQLVNEYYDANTSANFNNPNSNTQNYTNKYQFIELPVTLHTQLNRGKRLPITWDAGFSVSKLLSTNALHYDGLGGVYYQDNSLFNKTQWAVATGFNVQLFKHTQHPLTVGPVMRYNITPMLKKEFSTGQHVWAVGLRASVLLKK